MRCHWIAALAACVAGVTSASAAPVLLISIDGLHPRYVLEAERLHVAVPNLQSFVANGSYATGVVGVLPTVTYPSHTTIVTGVMPAEHGIDANTPFDPLLTNHDGWYWYAEDLKVPTLWTAAHAAGVSSASVNWPVTVGERSIDLLLPEFWRAGNAEDLKLLRRLSRPEGVLEHFEATLGPFVDGYTDTLESDEIRTRFALAVLRERKPGLMAVHLIALDGIEHRDGPFAASSYRTLEALDAMVGELTDAALANDAATAIVIVSDHGFIATHTAVNLRAPFVAAGLIALKHPVAPDNMPVIESWDAQVWNGGAVAGVVLRDPGNDSVRTRVAKVVEELRADPRNGIARVLTRAELAAAGAFPRGRARRGVRAGFLLRERVARSAADARQLEGHARLSAGAAGDACGFLRQRPRHRCGPGARRRGHAAHRADARDPAQRRAA